MNEETPTVAGTPADPTSRFVKLELGRQTYQLCYDFDSIAKAEEMSGMELLWGVNWTRITAPRLLAMLTACALKSHPEVKPETFKKHLTHKNILKIQSAVIDAWTSSTPDEDENPLPPIPDPANV